jgi:SAM-dependent methyltransferase
MIRAAVWQSTGKQSPARVLDLGAGTGRIGKAFVQANDCYVGVDFSLAMLQEFVAQSGSACLIQADGGKLPFPDGAFHVVLLMQVLSGARDWPGLLQEAQRVLSANGAIAVGKTATPENGIDAQLKQQLASILEEMGVSMHEPQKSRKQSLAWLEARATRRTHVTAAAWKTGRTPAEFLARHRTGARFAALPSTVQDEALQKLATWGQAEFGSLDQSFTEEHRFELDVFEIGA